MMPPKSKHHYIYHITHLDNLPGILDATGLCCESSIIAGQTSYRCIGYETLKDRRLQTPVPIAPFGCLADYVPFYFAPRSPMLYAIKKNLVQNYDGGQSPVIYLVSTVESVAEAKLPFVYTDGHAVIALSEFYNQLKELPFVDWEIMKQKYWNDSEEDSDRKRRRQAEFLVHRFFPLDQVIGIGVQNLSVRESVKKLLTDNGHSFRVRVKNEWYY